MHWLPKKYKIPSKARFIVAVPQCSIKPLSKHITSALKMFYHEIEHYNKKATFSSGVNTFWCIQNNRPVKEAIFKINTRNNTKSITTFDFSTLYTKIPHDKLIFVLNNLIDFCFKGGQSKFIALTNCGAKWLEDVKDYPIWFDVKRIKSAVKYLLDNCFFTVGETFLDSV